MGRKSLLTALVLSAMLILASGTAYAGPPSTNPTLSLLASGLDGLTGAGTAIGPDGALYVAEGHAGRISRVDPWTGAVTTYASGLPAAGVYIGGPMDVAFLDGVAYALVTLVSPDVGGSNVDGIYRIDGPTDWTVIADIGQFSMNNPPQSEFEVPTGVQYALEPFRGGFLVTDGHHNRVLWVGLDGTITEVIAFGDVVPTGLEVWGNTVYMAEAGPVPHEPENGRVISFGFKSPSATEVASGARLAVDVEFGLGRTLYALAQGSHPSLDEGTPADPNTGELLKVNDDGTMTPIMGGLDRPTSMEFIGNTAYFVTIGGEVWKIDDVSGAPYGVGH